MLSKLKTNLISLCQSGTPTNADVETKRKVFITNLFSFVGIGITALLGISALVHKNWPLGVSLILASSCFYIGHQFLKRTQNFKLPARGLLTTLSVLMLYLIYSGGAENTGPLWIYIIPPVALFLGGLLSGLIDIFIFVICCVVLMFYQDGALLATEYSEAFKLRLIYSFLTVTFLSYCYEYSRTLTFKNVQELSEKFENMAKHDALTTLPNRRAMLEKINTEFSRISRSHSQACIVLCDIDHFKSVNDTYGHEAGDHVLKEISAKFKSIIRQQDSVSRWGGEEFLFLLPDTNLSQASHAAENIRQRIETQEFLIEGQVKHISISIGIATLSEKRSITESIAQADKYLYEAKQFGRNRVCSSLNKVPA